MGIFMILSTMTWADISDTVRAVALHSHYSADRHRKAVMKIMAYLHGIRGVGLAFVRRSMVKLTLFRGADYADESNDKRLVSGMVVTLGCAVLR